MADCRRHGQEHLGEALDLGALPDNMALRAWSCSESRAVMQRIAIIFDNQARPETTGVYLPPGAQRPG